MSSIIYQNYKWVAGFDNEGGLVAVEDDVPRFMRQPFYVHSLGSWSDGIVHYNGDGMLVTTGFPSFDWIADIASEIQLNYIQATKTPGGAGLSGQVTVRTLFGNSGTPNYTPTFANFNAVLQLPQRPTLDRVWRAYRRVVFHFVVMEAL